MAKILVVEDDENLGRLLLQWLALDQHQTEVVSTGDEAFRRLTAYSYDLVVLDWQLPNLSGIDVLEDLRSRGVKTPVLMLTGKGDITHKERGFNAGADDYLTKPFHETELRARLRALLRRAGDSFSNDVLKWGPLELDPANFRVTRDGMPLHLRRKEFALLEFFMRNPGRVFAVEALLNRVWPTESESTADALTTCIRRLRQKIDKEGDPSLIRTIHGVGYSLDLEAG